MAKDNQKRASQQDIPLYNLKDSLTISKAIFDGYAGDPTTPLEVALALEIGPQSSNFRDKCGSNIAYGLTKGGYNSE